MEYILQNVPNYANNCQLDKSTKWKQKNWDKKINKIKVLPLKKTFCLQRIDWGEKLEIKFLENKCWIFSKKI
jgi:hypothetical protein